jgi:hypothetical protein
MFDQLIALGLAVGGALSVLAGVYFKGSKDAKQKKKLEIAEAKIRAKLRSDKLENEIKKNAENIDGLSSDDIDERLQSYYRDNNKL